MSVKYAFAVTITGSNRSWHTAPTASEVASEIESNLESAYPYAESIDVRIVATVETLEREDN